MIELRFKGVTDEFVAVRLEVDGVAVGSLVRLSQSGGDDGSDSITVKAVTGGHDIYVRVASGVVDNEASLLLSPGEIPGHSDIHRAAHSAGEVSHADAFGLVNGVVEKVVVGDVGFDGLARGLRSEVQDVHATSRAG